MDEKDVIEKLNRARMPGLKAEKRMAFDERALPFAVGHKKGAMQNGWMKYATTFAAVAAFTAITFIIVDNMDDGDRFNRNGGVWSTFTDEHEGGDSTVWPPEKQDDARPFVMSSPGYGDTGWAVHVTGRAGLKIGANYNYLGLVVRFSSESQCPACRGADISKQRGIRFKIKGSVPDGRLYFILPHEGEECIESRTTCRSLTGYADYEHDITPYVTPAWQTVAIDFREDMKQPFWASGKNVVSMEEVLKTVHLFKWQLKHGTGGQLDIWIDDVELY